MVNIIITDQLTMSAEAVSRVLSIGVESQGETYRLKSSRSVNVQKSSGECADVPVDFHIPFGSCKEEQEVMNEAQVFLMPEELSIFTQAIIAHPVLLPISYSQHLSIERGMYCLRLSSQEPQAAFAERLAGALDALNEQKS